jgi:hypothetical protein
MPQWDVAWHPNGRHILENERGLSAVRERRLRESSGTILAFVDDANVLDAIPLNRTQQWNRIA